MAYAELASIIFFFAVFTGIGSGIRTLFRMQEENVLQEQVLCFLFGLAAFIPATLLLGVLHVPIHWIAYLLIAIAGATYRAFGPSIKTRVQSSRIADGKTGASKSSAAKEERSKNMTWWRSVDWYLLIVILFAVVLTAVMYKGATGYPYLEDDDSWGHAEGAAYVSERLTFWQTPGSLFTHYLAPYTPFYTTMMGVLSQISYDIPWTLKLFNSILVGLMLIPAYLFFAAFTKNKTASVAMTGMLMLLPSFAGHFIWAQSCALVTFFIALHALVKAREDRAWTIWAAIAVATSIITNPLALLYNGLFFLFYWIGMTLHKVVTERSIRRGIKDPIIWRIFIICGIGFVAGVLYWGSMYAVYGTDTLTHALSLNIENGRWVAGDTSGGVKYGFSDFFVAPTSSHIDQATGLGAAMVILVLMGLAIAIVKARDALRKEWVVISILWLLVSILYVNGNRVAPSLIIGAHRFWPWLSIAVVLIAGFAIITLLNSVKTTWAKAALLAAFFVWIVLTAGYPKYVVQTAQWPPGVGWTAMEEIGGYASMRQTIPLNSRVFAMCNLDRHVLGFGMRTDPWDPEVIAFRGRVFNASDAEIIDFLTTHRYEYVTLDASCVRIAGENATVDLAERLSNTQRFQPITTAQGFLLAKVLPS